VRTDPRPDEAAMARYYPEDYAPFQNAAFRSRARTGLLKRSVDVIFRFNTGRLPLDPPGSLLEVGCATGVFLNARRLAGWEVEGVEPSEKAAAIASARGLPVHAGRLADAPLQNSPYDLVVAHMVLEHLHDPVAALKQWRGLVKPGGRLVVSTPNIGSLDYLIFRRNWYALQLPTHLYHFTPRTLKKMLQVAGWRVEKILHHRTMANYIGSLGILLEQATPLTGPGRALKQLAGAGGYLPYLLYPVSLVMAALGQTGRMTAWAQPSHD